MYSSAPKTKTIGLIEGAGTGKELIAIFKAFFERVIEPRLNEKIQFVQDPQIYHSYHSLINSTRDDVERFRHTSREDAAALETTMRNWSAAGVHCIFRTSINADALYLFRQKVKAIKTFGIKVNAKTQFLFVRDQAEGFYSNTSYDIDAVQEVILFHGCFTRSHVAKLIDFAHQNAKERWGSSPYTSWAFYKFHLFPLLEDWFIQTDKNIQALQPDTGMTRLNEAFFQNDLENRQETNYLIICSNEVGDLIFETILRIIDLEAKTNLYSKNFYLADFIEAPIWEYQTAHGSADDIAGKDAVLPYATLRIAADIAEHRFGLKEIAAEVDQAIGQARRLRLKNTSKIMDCIYHHLDK
jgi:isocitrate/isopropylmalate dehydrogenase